MALYIPRLLLLSIATFSLLYPNCIHAVKTKQAKKRVPPTQQQRFALIVAPAGNTSRHYMWLQDEDPIQGRNWDLALLYYGDNENFTCKECIAVWRGQGAKWNVIHRFLLEDPRFHNISQNYAAVTFMDDDLQITASVLNTFFEVFVAFDLTIAQPSCCMGSYSYWQAVTAQRDARVLHYTSFVELMAPTISAPFFDSIVRSTLEEAYTGWGLDFVWPYLAGWPTNKIAVVDAVCMLHGGQAPRKRVYESGLPMSPWEEWDRQLAKYNLTEHVVAEAGMQWKVPSEFGELLTNETVCCSTVAYN